MKVSLRWLSEYVDLPTEDPEEIRHALASLGHEVEGIERLTADWTRVHVAEVLAIHPHPDADKVRLCEVTLGGDPVDVVCGAWNFEAGARVAFASPGAVLAGGFEIGTRTIRGVTSHGMICSERELGLGEDHAGILVLADDAPIGAPLESVVDLPDVVFDLTITPNRPDAMSMVGIARDLGAFFGVPVRVPEPRLDPTPGSPSPTVDIADPTGCSRFTVRELHGVEVGPSPMWMRHRLRLAGVRPISNVVDVTNYVMLELGHPLHAFDGDRIRGGLVVRRARPGETLTTLDDVERALSSDDLVICDDRGPISLAGTMGGADTEVSDETGRVLLEAATWDPPTIMYMSRRHQLRSEASARFERGVDPHLPLLASGRAAELVLATGGGTLLEGVVDEVAVAHEPLRLTLTMHDVTRILGGGFEPEGVASLLASIGFGVSGSDPMEVVVPSYRPDVTRPVDLVEEIARLHGYDRFDSTVPNGAAGGWSPEQRRVRAVRAALVGAGLSQAVNLSFIGAEDLAAFAFGAEDEGSLVVRVRNPLRDEESLLRTTLLPGLLRSLRYNRSHGADSAALFETGKAFFDRPSVVDPRVPDQPDRVAFAVVGEFGSAGVDGRARPVDVYTATALWRVIADRLDLDDHELRPASAPGYHPGRCAQVVVRGRTIGFVGELHPRTAEAYELPGRVAVGELALDPLAEPVALRRLEAPSTFPPVEFDLAFVVDRSVPAASVMAVTRTAGGDLVEDVSVFDEFAGASVGEGRKSLAIRYVLRAPDRTLTNEEAGAVRRAMVEAAERELAAELRGAA